MRRLTWVRSTVGPVLVLAVVLGIAACGGSSSLSHTKLVAKANQACVSADAAVSKLGAPTASLAALTGYAKKVLPISKQLVQQLSALKPASGDQSALSNLVAALQNGDRGLSMMATATSTAQTNAASALITAKSVPSAATALGAASCGTSPSA